MKRNPRKNDIIVYRWGRGKGVPVLGQVTEADGERVNFIMEARGHCLYCATQVKRGTLKDGPRAAGTWRWPHEGEIVKKWGKWRFARAGA